MQVERPYSYRLTKVAVPLMGRVCMFNAPSGGPAGLTGHVGWAFQLVGTPDWYFGATEDGPVPIVQPQAPFVRRWPISKKLMHSTRPTIIHDIVARILPLRPLEMR